MRNLPNMEAHARTVLKELGAKALPIPEDLAFMSANFKGTEVTMRSQAWQTEAFRLVRETVLLYPGKLRSFNFVIYPFNHFDAPIFATDFLLLGNKLRIGLVDAMPLFAEDPGYNQRWVAPFVPLHRKAVNIARQYDRKMNWSLKYTGNAACLATEVAPEQLPLVCSLWQEYLQLYLQLSRELEPVPVQKEKQVQEWHRAYNKEHLEVENQRNPLMVYFGQETGRRYNREFLFAENFGKA